MNTSIEEGEDIELKPLNPPVPTETVNRATTNDEEPVPDFEDEDEGDDVQREGVSARDDGGAARTDAATAGDGSEEGGGGGAGDGVR